MLYHFNTCLFIRTYLKSFFAFKNRVSCTRLNIIKWTFKTDFLVKIKVVTFNTLTASPISILKNNPILNSLILTEFKVININTLCEALREIESIPTGVADAFLTAL